MQKRTLNILLYTLAMGFLAWHLLPIFSLGKTITPEKKNNYEIASDTMCYGGDIDVATFGDPLRDPVITTLSQPNKLVGPTQNGEVIRLDEPSTSINYFDEPDWRATAYGNNSVAFNIIETQHAKVLRINMNNFVSGDAKWQTKPIDVVAGQTIRVSSDYRTNVATTVNATLTYKNGSKKYITLSRLASTEQWYGQSSELIVPNNVSNVRFAIILNDNGWLESRNYSIEKIDTPNFKRGIASFTFDDGWKSIHEQGLPLFEKYNIDTTQFVVANYDINEAYMSEEQIRDLQKYGHNIGSHSFSHADHKLLHDADLAREVAGSRTVLNSKFGGVNNFATPFGRYNEEVNTVIRQCYQSHRTTDTGYNAPGYDRYQVRVQNVEVNTSVDEIREWANFAKEHNLWLVLVYHQVEDGGAYSVDTKTLESHLKAVKDSGIHIANYNDALIETYPQSR